MKTVTQKLKGKKYPSPPKESKKTKTKQKQTLCLVSFQFQNVRTLGSIVTVAVGHS